MSAIQSETNEAATEALVLEYARGLLHELRRTCREAPHGHVLAQVEQVAVQRGRELIRKTMEAVVNEQTPALEKKGLPSELVRLVKVAAKTKDASNAHW